MYTEIPNSKWGRKVYKPVHADLEKWALEKNTSLSTSTVNVSVGIGWIYEMYHTLVLCLSISGKWKRISVIWDDVYDVEFERDALHMVIRSMYHSKAHATPEIWALTLIRQPYIFHNFEKEQNWFWNSSLYSADKYLDRWDALEQNNGYQMVPISFLEDIVEWPKPSVHFVETDMMVTIYVD
jgi:hypothetical protein